jgi:hypothetical protein
MIKCQACGAENPDGTKICVKCATELPKAAAASQGPANPEQKTFGMKDMGRDLVDAAILFMILILIIVGFLGEATRWTFNFKEIEEAKLIEPSVEYATHPVSKHKRRHVSARIEAQAPVEGQPVVPFGNPEKFVEKSKEQFDQKKYHVSFNYLKQALEIDPTYARA